MSTLVTEQPCAGQTRPATAPSPARLTVRPREMATGTRNAQAGLQTLDSLKDFLVYVPKQCVGKHRCPLVVSLMGGLESSKDVMQLHRPLADRYGMILFVPSTVAWLREATLGASAVWVGGAWDVQDSAQVDRTGPEYTAGIVRDYNNADVRRIDAALKQILRKFAIDPDKIALLGASNGGLYTLFLGWNNTDVFSRIAPLSEVGNLAATGPRNTTTQFFITSGMFEVDRQLQRAAWAARELREEGYAVKQVLALRWHERSSREANLVWRWFQESWKNPSITTRVAPSAVADSVTVLTPEILASMTTFWQSFLQDAPDSIKPAAFQKTPDLSQPGAFEAAEAHHKPLPVLVGQQQMWVTNMGDMPEFAAKYPAVAAALKKAGLTARQEEAYRAAFIGAQATEIAGEAVGPAAATSALGKNVAFLSAHREAVKALENMMGTCIKDTETCK